MSSGAHLPSPGTPRTSGALDDTELVEGLRAGDTSAYELLVREHGGRMLAVARRVLRTEADAEDAVQDALVSVVRSIQGFDGTAQLKTWLHRVVVNAALMRLRTKRRHPTTPLEADEHEMRAETPRRGASTGTIERASSAELVLVVRRCLERLPEELVCAVRLRDIEGWDLRSICEVLDLGMSTLKVRLQRGRALLRTYVEAEIGVAHGS